jgi:hypothetical protein
VTVTGDKEGHSVSLRKIVECTVQVQNCNRALWTVAADLHSSVAAEGLPASTF